MNDLKYELQLEEALKAIPTIDEITFMKPCFPQFNRQANAINDDVDSDSKKQILSEKKKPKNHSTKKPDAFTEKDPTKEIVDLLTPF